jgi:hypothetical protein
VCVHADDVCVLLCELEDALGGVLQQLTGALEEQADFGVRMRRTDVLHDPLTAAHILGDFHCRRPEYVGTDPGSGAIAPR